MKNAALKGGILVGIAAASYGMLTTFVKMAYKEGYNTYEVTLAQLFLGFTGMFLVSLFLKTRKTQKKEKVLVKDRTQLIIAGSSLGLTSIFYYLAVQYISVSIGIVLLMQSVWISVVVDALAEKKFPSIKKSIAVVAVLTGTLLATNVLFEEFKVDYRGLGFGMLAALSYTATIFTSNKIAPHLHAVTRSTYMLLGGFIVVGLIVAFKQQPIDLSVFFPWGIILALFGTILPPLFMTLGMPKINMGTGAIITAIELPVAVFMAFFLLGERINSYQWLGIILILMAIIFMNLKKKKAAH